MTDMYDRLGLNVGRSEGSYGVEIETEGEDLPRRVGNDWRVEHDGSLKLGGLEYVFAKPQSLEGTKKLLDKFKAVCDGLGTKLNPSFRAGVHTHLNIQSYTPLELMTLVTTYYVLEDFFVHWAGKERVGNHFCLRVVDAEAVIQKVVEACERRDWRLLNTEDIRYASLNLTSMFKYGSIEFRAMRSPQDIDLVYRWVELIDQLAKGAKQFSSPVDVIQSVSELHGDRDAFIRNVMGDMADEFTQFKHINIFNGIRVVQPLAFMIDWKKFNARKVNPFV